MLRPSISTSSLFDVSTLLKPRAVIAYSWRVDLLDLQIGRQPQRLGQRRRRRTRRCRRR